jgi:hypothetical protein
MIAIEIVIAAITIEVHKRFPAVPPSLIQDVPRVA